MCCRYCFSTLLSRQRHWAWASFPVPEGTVPPTDVLPATSEMDSCAACCCRLCKAGSAGEGSRTVLGNNPSSSPVSSIFLTLKVGTFPTTPYGNSGWTFLDIFFCRDRQLSPQNTCSLSLATLVPGKWLLSQAPPFMQVGATVWLSSLMERPQRRCTSWATHKTLWGLSILLFHPGWNIDR